MEKNNYNYNNKYPHIKKCSSCERCFFVDDLNLVNGVLICNKCDSENYKIITIKIPRKDFIELKTLVYQKTLSGSDLRRIGHILVNRWRLFLK